MIYRSLPFLLGLVFLLALALNSYVLISAVDGARVVQQTEAAAGGRLTCNELYQARAIHAYFENGRSQQGEALYLYSVAWPIWIALSIGVAFAWTGALNRLKGWRWLPVFSMCLLVLLLILHLPAIAKISCAIE